MLSFWMHRSFFAFDRFQGAFRSIRLDQARQIFLFRRGLLLDHGMVNGPSLSSDLGAKNKLNFLCDVEY